MNIAKMQPVLVTVVLLIVAVEVTGKSTDGTNERFSIETGVPYCGDEVKRENFMASCN